MFQSFFRSLARTIGGLISRLLRGTPQSPYESIAFSALIEGGKTYRQGAASSAS